jgi:hypothetical protein
LTVNDQVSLDVTYKTSRSIKLNEVLSGSFAHHLTQLVN